MKLLLDENLSRRLLPSLESDYPGSTQVARVGLERASDLALWDCAPVNGCTIVTKDDDFSALSALDAVALVELTATTLAPSA